MSADGSSAKRSLNRLLQVCMPWEACWQGVSRAGQAAHAGHHAASGRFPEQPRVLIQGPWSALRQHAVAQQAPAPLPGFTVERPNLRRCCQAANVHAVLEGGPMVAAVLQRAGEAAHAVDDLAESLAIFDLKLRHMRAVRAQHLSRPTRGHLHGSRVCFGFFWV